jgi:polyribonucleotide 5'-hydroxyl-kinase
MAEAAASSSLVTAFPSAPKVQTIELKAQQLSVHFQSGSFVLLDGAATVFGAPVKKNVKYQFMDRGVPVEALGSARLDLHGIFTADFKPVDTDVLNIHAVLHECRLSARNSNNPQVSGPSIIVVGDADTGKSSLCRSLINLACRDEGFGVSFVDTDVGQGSITVPGSVAAAFVEGCLPIDDDFSKLVPLVFFFGDKSVTSTSRKRYLDACAYVSQCVTSVSKSKPEFRLGGTIINTMGWTRGLGHDLIRQLADIFSVTHIIVTGSDAELRDALTADSANFRTAGNVRVIERRRQASLFVRDRLTRIRSRSAQTMTYFCGTSRTMLKPSRIVVQFKDVVLLNAQTFQTISPAHIKPLCVAAVSTADAEEMAPAANVAGFLIFLDIGKQSFSALAPAPGDLPKNILLVSPSICVAPEDLPPF